ncbi:hypothetical protein BH11ACT3_BH11ACT3_17310 [soil metagenome]
MTRQMIVVAVIVTLVVVVLSALLGLALFTGNLGNGAVP